MSIPTTLSRILAHSDEETLAPYECAGCGACFEHRRHVCPTCGGYTIERTDWIVECDC